MKTNETIMCFFEVSLNKNLIKINRKSLKPFRGINFKTRLHTYLTNLFLNVIPIFRYEKNEFLWSGMGVFYYSRVP